MFGGEEARCIQGNFPEDKQTAETALLFLQLIMRKLRPVAAVYDRRNADEGRRSQTDATSFARSFLQSAQPLPSCAQQLNVSLLAARILATFLA